MFQIEPERRRGVESTVRQDRPTDRRTYRQPTDRSTGEKSHKKAIFLWQKQIQRRLRKKAPLIADKVKKERIKSIKSEKRRKKMGRGKRIASAFLSCFHLPGDVVFHEARDLRPRLPAAKRRSLPNSANKKNKKHRHVNRQPRPCGGARRRGRVCIRTSRRN